MVLALTSWLLVALLPPQSPEPAAAAAEAPSAGLESVVFDTQPGIQSLVEAVQADDSLTLRQLAAIALALMADGTTMNAGGRQDVLRSVTARIRRDTPPATPLPVFDELLVATALLRAGNFGHKMLRNSARASIERLCHSATDTTVPPLDAEQYLLLRLLAAEVTGCEQFDADVVQLVERTVRTARLSFRRGASRRSDAAHELARAISGEAMPEDRLVALTWPADVVADPVHTWIGVLAADRTAVRTRQATLCRLMPLAVVVGRGDCGPATVAPADGLDALTTAALHTMSLALANWTKPPR